MTNPRTVAPELRSKYLEHLQAHLNDSQSLLLGFYVEIIMKNAVDRDKQETEALQRKLDKMRVMLDF